MMAARDVKVRYTPLRTKGKLSEWLAFMAQLSLDRQFEAIELMVYYLSEVAAL